MKRKGFLYQCAAFLVSLDFGKEIERYKLWLAVLIPVGMQMTLVYLSDLHKQPIATVPEFNLYANELDYVRTELTTLEEILNQPAPSDENLERMFLAYANYYQINHGLLRTIAFCESRFDPKATNGKHAGMYQFNPTTWKATRERMSLDPDPNLRFDAEEAIKTAAFKIGNGGVGAWAYCSSRYYARS